MTAKRSSDWSPCVALLRGVNVGGNNLIKMSDLKVSVESLGFADVSTYINSGNVLFRSRSTDARKLEQKIEQVLERDFTVVCKVVIRTAGEIAQLVKALPQSWTGDAEWRYNVLFLRHTIDTKFVVNEFSPKPDIEQLVYVPGTLLWSARVKDVTRTAMQKLPAHKLFKEVTVRNLNTTRKLHELLQQMSA